MASPRGPNQPMKTTVALSKPETTERDSDAGSQSAYKPRQPKVVMGRDGSCTGHSLAVEVRRARVASQDPERLGLPL